MNKKQLEDFRNWALELNANSTHYQGCSEYHMTCALIRVIDAWEEEREAIVKAISHGHHDMAEVVEDVARALRLEP